MLYTIHMDKHGILYRLFISLENIQELVMTSLSIAAHMVTAHRLADERLYIR